MSVMDAERMATLRITMYYYVLLVLEVAFAMAATDEAPPAIQTPGARCVTYLLTVRVPPMLLGVLYQVASVIYL